MADGLPNDSPTPDPWHSLRALTPARIALGRAGSSLPTGAHLDFQLAHARARDAVHDALDAAHLADALRGTGLDVVVVHSAAAHRGDYLRRPDLGRHLDPDSRDAIATLAGSARTLDGVFVVADGLSARAAQTHAPPLLAALVPRLRDAGWRLAPIIVAEQGRVALGDEIGLGLAAAIVVVLLGERPGLSAPDSLGAYLTWNPRMQCTDAERNCVSNIRPEGLGYGPAADRLLYLMTESRRRRLSGVSLKDESGTLRP